MGLFLLIYILGSNLRFYFLIFSQSSFNGWKVSSLLRLRMKIKGSCIGTSRAFVAHRTPLESSGSHFTCFHIFEAVYKSRAFVAHRKRVCCRPDHVYFTITLSIVIEFRFVRAVMRVLLHIAPYVVVAEFFLREMVCCTSHVVLLSHRSRVLTLTLSIVIEFPFPREAKGFLLHVACCVVVAGWLTLPTYW